MTLDVCVAMIIRKVDLSRNDSKSRMYPDYELDCLWLLIQVLS